MPAITVDDITVLPRIPSPDPMVARQRPVRQADDRAVAASRARASRSAARSRASLLEDLDPFIHLDQMGEVEYAPGEAKGTPWHPHRGFETVTYMLDGVFEHNDSNGGGGVITNGDTQWMTAGAGILHIEKPAGVARRVRAACSTASSCGSTCRGRRSSRRRATRTSGRARSRWLSSPDGGALVRVIAGEVAGHAGPGITYTPMTLVHATLAPGADPRSCRGGPTTTRSPTCWPVTAPSAPRGVPRGWASSRSSARATR